MQWKPHTLAGTTYPLDHIHPFSFTCIIPAKDGKPEQHYTINVIFGLHCFTRGCRENEAIPEDLAYSDSRETRIFDLERYEQSKGLRALVGKLADAKCFHDGYGNFYVFEIVDKDGTTRYYAVFFTLSRATGKGALNLYITSAHLRAERPYAHKVKPVAFRVLVYNTYMGKSVKPAP